MIDTSFRTTITLQQSENKSINRLSSSFEGSSSRHARKPRESNDGTHQTNATAKRQNLGNVRIEGKTYAQFELLLYPDRFEIVLVARLDIARST